jgi:hypothetical protein
MSKMKFMWFVSEIYLKCDARPSQQHEHDFGFTILHMTNKLVRQPTFIATFPKLDKVDKMIIGTDYV